MNCPLCQADIGDSQFDIGWDDDGYIGVYVSCPGCHNSFFARMGNITTWEVQP